MTRSNLTRWVVLRHTGHPEAPPHFDWLLERADGPGRNLIAFRTPERPDVCGIGGFSAERLPDHRPLYLDYEGEISGGRGRVERVAQGMCRIAEAETLLTVILYGYGLKKVLDGRRRGGAEWDFRLLEEASDRK